MMSLPPDMMTGDASVDALDVTAIVQAVQTANGWSATQALDAEKWYRRFLALTKQEHRGGTPLEAVFGLDKEADLIWHEHITWTIKYRADSEAIFGAGEFLNHTPNKPPDWQKRLADSLALYQRRWHESPPDANICCT
jgi:hypothetical protein